MPYKFNPFTGNLDLVEALDADLVAIAALTVARGALIVGNSTPEWGQLPIGAAGTLLGSNGTDALWGGLGPTTPTTFTAGSVLFVGTAGVLTESADLFWNNSTKQFGIGTVLPLFNFHIKGLGTTIADVESADAGAVQIRMLTDGATSLVSRTAGGAVAKATILMLSDEIRFRGVAGTDKFTFNALTPALGIGVSPTANLHVSVSAQTIRLMHIAGGSTMSVAQPRMVFINPGLTTDQNGAAVIGISSSFVPTFAGTLTTSYGMFNICNIVAGSGVTLTDFYSNAYRFDIPASWVGTCTNAYTHACLPPGINAAGADPVNLFGLHIANHGNPGTTNSYGLYVAAQTGSANNYAAIFADGPVGIGTLVPLTQLHVSGADKRIRLQNTSAAPSALSLSMAGLELVSDGMNSANLYGVGLKFMSLDTSLTTESPKFLAGVFGRNTEAYTLDTHGGMAIDFFTTPNTPGATSVPVFRGTIDQSGHVGWGTTTPAQMVEFEQTETITASPADGYAAALRLDPGYSAASAQTVTRHNYIDVQNVSVAGAGPAAVTDACVLRFDAAAGTHKATIGATTKVTPGLVAAWVKVNMNGTVLYMPAYASTTA